MRTRRILWSAALGVGVVLGGCSSSEDTAVNTADGAAGPGGQTGGTGGSGAGGSGGTGGSGAVLEGGVGDAGGIGTGGADGSPDAADAAETSVETGRGGGVPDGALDAKDAAETSVSPETGSDADGASCTAPVSGPCNPLPQCGCPAQQNCEIVGFAGETDCVSVGTRAPYEACAIGECPKGYSCDVTYACKPFCADDNDCPTGHCYQTAVGVPGTCSRGCNPLAPQSSAGGFTACGSGVSCQGFPLAPSGADSDCMYLTGVATEDMACDNDSDPCAAGMACVDLTPAPDGGARTPVCHKWCRIGVTGDCTGGRTCVSVYGAGHDIVLRGTAFGVCSL